jgi:predicted dinucleotide-utilizing enzyme
LERAFDLIRRAHSDDLEVVGAFVPDPGRQREDLVPRIVSSVSALLEARPTVFVEVGGHEARRAHGPDVLRAGCVLFMVSVGALADPSVDGNQQKVEADGVFGSLRFSISKVPNELNPKISK